MSFRAKGAIWIFIAALLIGTAVLNFHSSGLQSFKPVEIAADIVWAAGVAIIAAAWGFKYVTRIAETSSAIRAFGWGCLIACVSLITFDLLLWLVFMIVGIIGWLNRTSPELSNQSFTHLLISFLFGLPLILVVSFYIAFVGVVLAGIAGCVFWVRYRD